MKYLYLLLFIILLFLIFSWRVSIYIRTNETTDIVLKIGPFLRFKLKNPKISKICQSLTKYDFTVFINQDNTNNIDWLLKELIVDKITIINCNNIFNNLWNIYIPFSYNILNLYLDNVLSTKFKKVTNKYYSTMFTTTGTYKLNFEIVLSIRVYQLIKLLIVYLKNKKKVKYDTSN